MACFIVPAAEAIITSVAAKAIKNKEAEHTLPASESSSVSQTSENKIPFSRKLKWLTNLLWGGSVLLAFEHLWHGEVIPWFPFLTAADNAADAAEMLHEMATVGVAMSVLVTAIWGVMLIVTAVMEKKSVAAQPAADSEA